MNKTDRTIALILKELHLDELASFDAEMIQYRLFLLQYYGFGIEYVYTWETGKPYSYSLERYIHKNYHRITKAIHEEEQNDAIEAEGLPEEVLMNILKVNALAAYIPDRTITMKDWYELLASLAYILNNRTVFCVTDEKSFLMAAKMHLTKFSGKECDMGRRALNKMVFGF